MSYTERDLLAARTLVKSYIDKPDMPEVIIRTAELISAHVAREVRAERERTQNLLDAVGRIRRSLLSTKCLNKDLWTDALERSLTECKEIRDANGALAEHKRARGGE